MRIRLGCLAMALWAAGCQRGADAPWLTMPSPAAHAAWFPIDSAAVHGVAPGQSPDCDRCHFDKGAGAPSSTFRTFTCTNSSADPAVGCHVAIRPGVHHDTPADLATLHATVATYDAKVASYVGLVASPANGGVGPQSPEDGACRECHPTGMAVDHATRFPLPHRNTAGTIVAICSDCHRDFADRSRLGCAACHPHDGAATVTAHAKAPGFEGATASSPAATIEAASALCARCHGDGVVPVTIAAHAATFVVGSGVHAGTAGGGCLDCHPALRAPPKGFAADFARTTCSAACHGTVPVTAAGRHDDGDGALRTYHVNAAVPWDTQLASSGSLDAACLACHPDGQGGLPANHPFPVGAAPAHPPEACSHCHTTVTARNVASNFACETCHLGLDPSLPTKHSSPIIPVTDYSTAKGFTAASARCLYCHGDSQVNRAASHPGGDGTPLADAAEHRTAGCSNCHKLARADKPFAADWGRTDCSTCHPGGPPSGN
jgi:hypothetical protein